MEVLHSFRDALRNGNVLQVITAGGHDRPKGGIITACSYGAGGLHVVGFCSQQLPERKRLLLQISQCCVTAPVTQRTPQGQRSNYICYCSLEIYQCDSRCCEAWIAG